MSALFKSVYKFLSKNLNEKYELLKILPQYKRVRIMTECQPWWEYKTKSKTVFQIQIIDGEMKFFVIIPANRDKDVRQHYSDLRIIYLLY